MNIYQKLVEVRKSVPYLQQNTPNQNFKATKSSQVVASLRGKIDELGLLLTPKILSSNVSVTETKTRNGNTVFHYFTELHMEMVWINAENPEETVVCPWYAQGMDYGSERGVGKALTYAERYFLLKFFNIPTDEDDPDLFQSRYYEDAGEATKVVVPIPKKTGEKKEELISRIAILCSEKNLSPEWLDKKIENDFGKGQLKDLTITELTRVASGLERYKQEA